MKTTVKTSLQASMQYLFPELRPEVAALIQAFDLEMVAAARK